MIIECCIYPSPQVRCKKCNIRFFEKSGLKNVASRPVRDNILVEWKIPPDTKVPSGTKCFLLHITSLTGQGVKGCGVFYRYNVPDGTKKTNILKH